MFRKNISLRSSLRQPVRVLCLCLLCAICCAAFLTQALQGWVLSDAINEIGGYYRAYGSFSPLSGNPDQRDISACLDLIEDSDLVSLIDVQRCGTYTMDDHYTAATVAQYLTDPAYSSYYLRGRCSTPDVQEGDYDVLGEIYRYRLSCSVGSWTLIEGLPDTLVGLPSVSFLYFSNDPQEIQDIQSQLVPGQEILLKLHNIDLRGVNYFLIQPMGEQGLYAYPLTSGKAIDYTDPLLAGVEEDIRLLSINIRSSGLITTKDMTAMASFNENYVLTEGRLLNANDNENGNRVCVIPLQLAQTSGLGVGDRLDVTLWDLDTPYSSTISLDEEGKSLDQLGSVHESLEIVGIVYCTAGWGVDESHIGTIFIPDSCLPEDFITLPFPNRYYTSVALRSMEDQDEFLKRYEDQFLALGWQFSFVPNGWTNFADAARPLYQSAMTSAVIFGAVALLALVLTVFLFTVFRRKELALQRALGCKQRSLVAQAMLPLGLMGTAGILLGSVFAYHYGLDKVRQTLSGIAADYPVSIHFSPGNMAVLTLPMVLLFLLLSFSALLSLTGRPVLEQLQANARPEAQRGKNEGESAPAPLSGVQASPVSVSREGLFTPPPAGKAGWGLVCDMRWVLRHFVRRRGQSLLSLLTAACFLVGLCFLQSSIVRNQERMDQLYTTVEVDGQILNKSGAYVPGNAFFPGDMAKALEEKGLFAEVNKVAGGILDVSSEFNTGSAALPQGKALPETETAGEQKGECVVGPSYRAYWSAEDCAELQNGSLSIIYCDPTVTDEDFFSGALGDNAVVLSSDLIRLLNTQPGKQIMLFWSDYYQPADIVGYYLSSDEIPCDVIFSAQTLIPLLEENGQSYGYTSYSFRIDPAHNKALPEFREFAEQVLTGSSALTELIFVMRDMELTQAVEPLERSNTLLRVLYPVVQVLAVVAAGALASLLVVQCGREISILRVLGLPRRRTVGSIAAGQLLPALTGLCLGLLIVLLLLPGVSAPRSLVLQLILYTSGCLAGAGVTAFIVTKKNPLELLQIKE